MRLVGPPLPLSRYAGRGQGEGLFSHFLRGPTSSNENGTNPTFSATDPFNRKSPFSASTKIGWTVTVEFASSPAARHCSHVTPPARKSSALIPLYTLRS